MSDSASSDWTANQELVTRLTEMGITAAMAQTALRHTGNSSVEVAIAWIFENSESASSLSSGPAASDRGLMSSADADNEIYKMVFVVNSELNMGIGKVAAQVAHAALGLNQLLLQNESRYGGPLICWAETGETKIVLKGESTAHLMQLEKQAMEAGLPAYLVQDAGKTQVPSGSTTVLSIFGRIDAVDSVTGSLRLL